MTALRRAVHVSIGGAALLAGCTHLLGIDESYVSAGSSPCKREEAGVVDGQGGTASGGSGGVIGSGGDPVNASGGASPEDGAVADSGSGCRPGHYTGSFDGSHRPLVTFVGVPANVSAGTVSFDLNGNGNRLTVEGGKLEARLTNLIVPDAGTFSATLTGQFDCATREIVEGELSGRMEIVNILSANVTGTWHGTMSASGEFTGSWSEREPRTPGTGADAGSSSGVCIAGGSGTTQPIGMGCGTWNAR